jgi:hypothetical protein
VRQADRKGSFVDNLVGKKILVRRKEHALNVFLSRHINAHRRGYLAHVIGAPSQ